MGREPVAEPANRKDRPQGGKYYEHPTTGEKFDSVTTILDIVDKAALKIWAGMVAADFAMDHLPQLMQSVLVQECGNTFNRCFLKHGPQARCERCPCGDCERCWWRRVAWRHEYESKRRAQEGTECHEAIDFWIASGGRVMSIRPEVQPYFDSFLQFARDYGLQPNNQGGVQGSWEQTEVTLLNREHMYAGTSDGAIHIGRTTLAGAEIVDRLGGGRGALVRLDYKTREKEDERLYYDMPLQGVAYERARVALLRDGQEIAAPETDGRAILQLRPGGYSFKLMLSDDLAFAAFLQVLGVYRWINGPGKKPFDLDHFPIVEYTRSVETVATILDAEIVESEPATHEGPEREPTAVETVEIFAQELAPVDDLPPWDVDPDPVAAFTSTEPVPGLPDLPLVPPPAKKTAKKTTKVSATQDADPFALAGGATLASMSASTFKPGPRQSSLLDEEIPF